jgi:hypothetical protein
MPVHDRTGKALGAVEYVYLGEVAESPAECHFPQQSPSAHTSAEGSLIEEFAKAILLTEGVPELWRERLLSFGFIRISNSRLFSPDSYALPSQIAGVAEGRVLLYVDRHELLSA